MNILNKFFSNVRLNCKINACEVCVNRHLHKFRSIVPWENTVEFSEHLANSVVYNSNGLLVLNKPYGITFSRDGANSTSAKESKLNPEDVVFKKQNKTETKKTDHPYFTSGCVSDSLNLVEALPYLKNHFGLKHLYISRVPEKCVSGVAVLTTSPELADKVIKSRRHSPTGKDKYLIIVAGVPRYEKGTIKLAFSLESDPKMGKRVVLLQKWSNNAFKRGDLRIGTFHYQTLSRGYNNLTSLIEVRVDLRKYHAYRVFCSDYLLSPVLGDNLFGSRVQTVMGVPMAINRFSDAANTAQKLPDDVYTMLELNPPEAAFIPVHVHLDEMLLPRLLKGEKDVVLKASPPPHFQWACEKLGLTQFEQFQIAAV